MNDERLLAQLRRRRDADLDALPAATRERALRKAMARAFASGAPPASAPAGANASLVPWVIVPACAALVAFAWLNHRRGDERSSMQRPTAAVTRPRVPSMVPRPLAPAAIAPCRPGDGHAAKYADVLQKNLAYVDTQRTPEGGWRQGATGWRMTSSNAYALAMLSWAVVAWEDGFREACQHQAALRQVTYGAQHLLGAVADDGRGGLEIVAGQHLGRGTWYRVTAEVPGPDVAGHVAAAMAAASLALRSTDQPLSEKLRARAEEVFRFGDAHRGDPDAPARDGRTVVDPAGNISHAVPLRGGGPDKLLWAAAWLHRAHVDRPGYDGAYLARATALMHETRREADTPLVHWRHHSVFQTNKGAAVLLALTTGAQPWAELAQNHLDWWTVGYTDRVRRTPDGLAWRQPGKALHAAAAAAFLATVYADGMTPAMCEAATRRPQATACAGAAETYRAFAQQTIEYALGANAGRRSWVVDGALSGGPDENGRADTAGGVAGAEASVDAVAPFAGVVAGLIAGGR